MARKAPPGAAHATRRPPGTARTGDLTTARPATSQTSQDALRSARSPPTRGLCATVQPRQSAPVGSLGGSAHNLPEGTRLKGALDSTCSGTDTTATPKGTRLKATAGRMARPEAFEADGRVPVGPANRKTAFRAASVARRAPSREATRQTTSSRKENANCDASASQRPSFWKVPPEAAEFDDVPASSPKAESLGKTSDGSSKGNPSPTCSGTEEPEDPKGTRPQDMRFFGLTVSLWRSA